MCCVRMCVLHVCTNTSASLGACMRKFKPGCQKAVALNPKQSPVNARDWVMQTVARFLSYVHACTWVHRTPDV